MMNMVIKWLHRNDVLVHMIVTLLVFYGIPTMYLSFVNPGMVAPIINSAIAGFTIVALFFISFKAAAAATDLIKIAAERADMMLIQGTASGHESSVKDPVVDYASPTMLVMDSLVKHSGSVDITLVPQPSDAPAQQAPAERRRRGRPAKSSKKEG